MNRSIFGILMTLTLVCGTPVVAQTITLTRVSSNFARPVFATSAPGDSGKLYVTEQHTGQVRVMDVETGSIEPQPFLQLNNLSTGNEQGLLGLAFHPDYETNGRLFVNYTHGSGDTVVEEYQRGASGQATGIGTAVLSVEQPQANHNAGWIGFGPNGLLHIATGDGGAANDSGTGHGPIGNSQDITNNLLGKILRIDVDGDDFASDATRNYAVPANTPFVGQTGDDEILAYGLRNPYRSSFDRRTGDLFIADVGQGAREEIDVIPAGTAGQNFGWRGREGFIDGPFNDPVPNNLVDPIHDYDHSTLGGFSVTGGYVYRGPITALQGKYFFADFVTDNLWSLEYDGTTATSVTPLHDEISVDFGALNNVSSFAEDEEGNLYVIELGGTIYRFGFDLPGDLTGDGNVNAADIDLYADFLGQPANGEASSMDIDNNGFITLDDQQQLIETFAQTTDGEFGTLVGDINFDGQVDVLNDAATLVNSLGNEGESVGYANGDLNADRRVDVLNDAATLIDNLGRSRPATSSVAAAAVPEPCSSLAMMIVLAATVSGRRRSS